MPTDEFIPPESLLHELYTMRAYLEGVGEPWKVARHVRKNVDPRTESKHVLAAGELLSWLSYYMREFEKMDESSREDN